MVCDDDCTGLRYIRLRDLVYLALIVLSPVSNFLGFTINPNHNDMEATEQNSYAPKGSNSTGINPELPPFLRTYRRKSS